MLDLILLPYSLPRALSVFVDAWARGLSEIVCLHWDVCGKFGERVFDQGCHVQGFC